MRKKKVEERLGAGYTEHRNTAMKNRKIGHKHAKNRRANNKKFCMFRYNTISEFKTTITEVPHENLANTIMPQTFSM